MKYYVVSCLLFLSHFTWAQQSSSMTNHNPSIASAELSFDEKSNEGLVSFDFVETSSDYHLLKGMSQVHFTVCLLNAIPQGESLEGKGNDVFLLDYDASSNCFLAKQIGNINRNEYVDFRIPVKLEVAHDLKRSQKSNLLGFTVNIQPVASMNGFNKVDDDFKFDYLRLNLSDGVSDRSDENLFVYPNPGNGVFNVDFVSQTNEPITLTVRSIDGMMHLSNSYAKNALQNESVDLSQLSVGLYIIEVVQDQNMYSKKVIIQH